MANRHRSDSYGNYHTREEDCYRPDFYPRPRSPHHSSNWHNTSLAKNNQWVNPNLSRAPSSASRDYTSNRYTDSRNVRDDSRSAPSDDRSFASRSLQHKSPPSPSSPSPSSSRRSSDQVSHRSTSDARGRGLESRITRPAPPASKPSFSVPPTGNTKKRDHAEFLDEPEPENITGFNIRGLSTLQSNKVETVNGVRDTDTHLAMIGSKRPLPSQPNGIHAPSDEHSKGDLPQLELLMKHLSQFAQTLSTDACLTNEHEAVEAKLAKVQHERDKWRSYHSSFASLSEDQEKEIKDHKAALARIKLKQREHHTVQENAIRLMATTLLTTQSNGNMPQLDGHRPVDPISSRLESLETQFSTAIKTVQGAAESNSWETKTKLTELEQGQQTIQLDVKKFKSESNEAQRSIAQQTDDKVAQLDIRLSSLHVPSVITKEFSDVGVDIKLLRSQLDRITALESTKEHIDQTLLKIEDDFQDFKSKKPTYDGAVKKLENLGRDFHRLNDEVVGNGPDNPGLLAIIEESQKHAQSNETDAQQMQCNVAAVQDEMEELSKKMKDLESSGGSTLSRLDTGKSGEPLSIISQRLERLERVLEDNVIALRKEAEAKDELIGEEIDGVNQRMTRISDEGQELRKRVDGLQSDIGLQRPTPNIENHLANGVGPVELNGLSHNHEPYASPYVSSRISIIDTLKEQSSVLESHHNFLVDLESKFNNLTSDELADKMILQMQRLYPFASSAQNEITGLKNNVGKLQLNINQLNGGVYNLDIQVKQRSAWEVETRKVVENVGNDLNKLQATVMQASGTLAAHTTKFEVHETKLGSQEADVAKFSQAFESVKLQARLQLSSLGESVGALEKKLASLESDTKNGTAKMHSKVAVMWKEESKDNGKFVSPISTSPKTGSPTASPSAPPSPQKVLHMRKKERSKERVEESDMEGGSKEDKPSKKRARLDVD